MSHSPKITDIDPHPSNEEVKDVVQAPEFEVSNSGEAEGASLRGASIESEEPGPSPDSEDVPADPSEDAPESAEESGEASEGDSEAAEALRTLHALETVLKGEAGSEGGRNPFEREIPSVLPVLPLRDIVVFNSMIIPLFENREKGMETVERALNGSRYLLLCAQRDADTDEPVPSDLYDVGSVVMILRMIKMADGQIKLLVQGLARAHVDEFDMSGSVLMARVSVLEEERTVSAEVSDIEIEAMMRHAREQSEQILQLRGLPSGEIMGVLKGVDEPGRLADIIAANMRLSVPDGQGLLECLDPVERLRMVNTHLLREVEVATMQARIQSMAREGMDISMRIIASSLSKS